MNSRYQVPRLPLQSIRNLIVWYLPNSYYNFAQEDISILLAWKLSSSIETAQRSSNAQFKPC